MNILQYLKAEPPAFFAAPSAAREPAGTAPPPGLVLPPEAISTRLNGAAAQVVPALHTVFHALDLPVRGARQRQAALPFALEDDTALPVDRAHFTLIGETPGGQCLAAALGRDVMQRAVAAHPGQKLVPELCLLPPPDLMDGEVARWAVWRHGQMALVRVSDGTGFAARADQLPHLWRSAGTPPVDSYGAKLPDTLPSTARDAADLPAPGPLPDLRQGGFAPKQRLRAPLFALAACVLLALAGHLGLMFADLQVKRATSAALRAEAEALLSRTMPGAHVSDDPRLLYRRIAAGTRSAPGFLAVFATAAGALAEAPIRLSDLSWSSRDRLLSLQAEAAGIDALQAAEAALRDAGLAVSAGAVAASDGSARMTLRIEAPG